MAAMATLNRSRVSIELALHKKYDSLFLCSHPELVEGSVQSAVWASPDLTDSGAKVEQEKMIEPRKGPSKRAKRYTEQFRRDAVELLAGGASVEKIAQGLDISPVTLRAWRKHMAGKADAPPGWTTQDLQAENQRLREQLVSMTAQRDILKKACGILSQAPTKGMPQ
jgi:transposase-like protein